MLFKIGRRGKMDTVAIKEVILILGLVFFISMSVLALWFFMFTKEYKKEIEEFENKASSQGIVFKK